MQKETQEWKQRRKRRRKLIERRWIRGLCLKSCVYVRMGSLLSVMSSMGSMNGELDEEVSYLYPCCYASCRVRVSCRSCPWSSYAHSGRSPAMLSLEEGRRSRSSEQRWTKRWTRRRKATGRKTTRRYFPTSHCLDYPVDRSSENNATRRTAVFMSLLGGPASFRNLAMIVTREGIDK